MDNFSLVKKYDTLSINNITGEKVKNAFNWILVRNKGENTSGLAMIHEENKVQFISDNEKNDMIIGMEEFNNNFIIEKITDHWGNEIEDVKKILEKINNRKKVNILEYFKKLLVI